MIYVIDTNILSAYAETPGTPEAQAISERAEWTIDRLRKDKATLFIPSPVLMEYLVIKDPSTHPTHTAELNRVFDYVDLDVMAAMTAAAILRRYHQDRSGRRKSREKLPKDHDKYNDLHAIDAQIVAIAKGLRGCKGIYSLDSDIKTLAEYARVPVFDLDTTREELFTEESARVSAKALAPPRRLQLD